MTSHTSHDQFWKNKVFTHRPLGELGWWGAKNYMALLNPSLQTYRSERMKMSPPVWTTSLQVSCWHQLYSSSIALHLHFQLFISQKKDHLSDDHICLQCSCNNNGEGATPQSRESKPKSGPNYKWQQSHPKPMEAILKTFVVLWKLLQAPNLERCPRSSPTHPCLFK